MVRLISSVDRRHEAADLWGVRVCVILVGLSALGSALCSVLVVIVTCLTLVQHSHVGWLRLCLLLLCCGALTYLLLRISVGLFQGLRLAQIGGIAWGVALLLFCWMLVHDARGPVDPKAPDAQELNGLMFIIAAPSGLWMIGYLSLRGSPLNSSVQAQQRNRSKCLLWKAESQKLTAKQ